MSVSADTSIGVIASTVSGTWHSAKLRTEQNLWWWEMHPSNNVSIKNSMCYDPAIPLLGIYPEKSIIQKESCTAMFIAALFTMARTWKQPKCPSTDEWIKKMWPIYTMEYYSAIKSNEIELFVVRWMDLESVIQSEVSQKERNKYHMLTHIYGI